MARLFWRGGGDGGKGSMWPIHYQSVAPNNFLVKILRNWPCVVKLCPLEA